MKSTFTRRQMLQRAACGFGAILQFHTGTFAEVRPSMGAWVSYGLGTENANLPSFVSIQGGGVEPLITTVKGRPALDFIQWRELCHSLLASNEFVFRL